MENAIIPLKVKVDEQVEQRKTKKIKYRCYIYIVTIIIVIGCLSSGFELYKDYKRDKIISNLFIQNVYSDKSDVLNNIKIVQNLPTKVTDILIQNNVKIDYIPWQPKENAVAQFKGLDKLILVNYINSDDTNIFDKYCNEINTIHEIGHAFDYDYALNLIGYAYSGIEEFRDIYKEEAGKLFSTDTFKNSNTDYLNYFVSARWEYFAESFAFYFASDETNKILQEKAPKTFDFIKKVTNDKKRAINNIKIKI